jgi:hypothetical protein
MGRVGRETLLPPNRREGRIGKVRTSVSGPRLAPKERTRAWGTGKPLPTGPLR